MVKQMFTNTLECISKHLLNHKHRPDRLMSLNYFVKVIGKMIHGEETCCTSRRIATHSERNSTTGFVDDICTERPLVTKPLDRQRASYTQLTALRTNGRIAMCAPARLTIRATSKA